MNNKNPQRRSPPRRLPLEVVNWLRQLYAINPYPDRFQMGSMALHCKIETLRIKNWFQNRRVSDCRNGILCRRCRYFKSPLASEELHFLYPFTRHCVLLSMPQFSYQNLVIDAGLTMTIDSPPPQLPTSNEVDYNKNNSAQIESNHSIRDDFPVQPVEHQLQTRNIYTPYDGQITEPCQQQIPQLGPRSHSSQMQLTTFSIDDEKIQEPSLQWDEAYAGLNRVREVALNSAIASSSNATYDCYRPTSQSSSIVNHNWIQRSAPASLAPIKLEEHEFALQEFPDLNFYDEVYSEDYSEIAYSDYMDFPNFSLPVRNVNLNTF